MPCKHVCACTVYQRENFKSYYDEVVTTSKLLVAYGEVIHHMHDIDVNSNRGDYPDIGPLTLKRLPDRPRKARRKSNVEGPSGTQQARRSNTVRCFACKQFRHNYRTCWRALVKKNSIKQVSALTKIWIGK